MKRALLIVLVLMIISTVWCQNGTPTVLSAQINVPGNNVFDFIVTSDYFYIANNNYLNKYSLSTKEMVWSWSFPNFYGNGNNQGMFKTSDNNLVITYDGIVTKMSAEDDSLWQTVLPGRVALSYDQPRNRIICYSWDGLLTVLSLDDGQILLQKQMPFEGLTNSAYHSAVAVSESEFILADNTIYGINWNSAVLVSKVSVNNGVVNVIWQHSFVDLGACNMKKIDDNSFYLNAREITVSNNNKIFFFEDNGNNYTITDSIDAGGPSVSVYLDTTIPVGQNILTVGLSADNTDTWTRAVFTVYDREGKTRASQVNNQTDFTVYRGLSESGGGVYTVLVTRDYFGGPRTFYLTELTSVYNSAVSTDPDTPTTPQLNLTCYPTPTRVGNNVNVKFETKSKDVTTIEVYNIKGQKVRTLVNSNFSSGQHQTTWNGRTDNGTPVSSGMYFFRMKSGTYSATKKVVLIK